MTTVKMRHRTLGEALRDECHRRGVTQEQASLAMGQTANQVNRWIRNNSEPQPPAFEALMAFLGVSLDELGGLMLAARMAKWEPDHHRRR